MNNVNNIRCSGCGGCINVCVKNCISMTTNAEGFFEAHADESQCINCGLCIAHCSMKVNMTESRHPITAWASYSKENDIRNESTSGGIFTMIARDFLQSGGIVYGAAYIDGHVKHCRIDSESNLYMLRGSKYVQSDAFGCQEQLLLDVRQQRRVLFSGTPCQIHGIHTLLRNENMSNVYAIDLICHGVPSPAIFDGYKKHLERRNKGKIVNYKFRSKCNASEIISYNSEVSFCQAYGNKKDIILDGNEDPYVMRFLTNALQAEACYSCPYAADSRISDLTLGDYWGSERVFPHLVEEAKRGISLVLVNTEKGSKLFEGQKRIEKIATTENQYIPLNSHLRKPAVRGAERDLLYSMLTKNGFSEEYYYRYFLPKGYWSYILKRRIKGILKK